MHEVKKFAAISSLALAGYLAYNVHIVGDAKTQLTPVNEAHYVDRATVISALNTRSQLVGLTGKVAKEVTFEDSAWYGDKTVKLAATGTFKLGTNTQDISVTVVGNTVKVRMPHPHIISVDMPFDKAAISKDVGMFRKDLNEAELQRLYGKARTSATEDIKRNRQAFDKAERSVEMAVEALVAPVNGVEHVVFEEAK